MPGKQIATVATHTARSIRRRLAAAARERSRSGHATPPAGGGHSPGAHYEQPANDARLDALRGELVRELDRLAAADDGGSASFRRI